MRRAVLHGIGEPLLNNDLPQIIAYLKRREIEVLFNSNGTLLTPAWQEALVRSGLDEYRCSIDGAEPADLRPHSRRRLAPQDRAGAGRAGADPGAPASRARPRISIWCVVTKENLQELPDLVRLAARLGVPEVYVQRMTYFGHEPEAQYGMARRELAIFGTGCRHQDEIIAECEALSTTLGVDFRAAGARDPRNSLAAARPAD